MTTGCDWDLLYNGSTEEISQGTRNSSPAPSSSEIKPAAQTQSAPAQFRHPNDAPPRSSTYASTNNTPSTAGGTAAAAARTPRGNFLTSPIGNSAISAKAAAEGRAGVAKQFTRTGKIIAPVLKNPYVRGAGAAGTVVITGGALHSHLQDNIYYYSYEREMDALKATNRYGGKDNSRTVYYGANPSPQNIIRQMEQIDGGVEYANTREALQSSFMRQDAARREAQIRQSEEQAGQQQECWISESTKKYTCRPYTGR